MRLWLTENTYLVSGMILIQIYWYSLQSSCCSPDKSKTVSYNIEVLRSYSYKPKAMRTPWSNHRRRVATTISLKQWSNHRKRNSLAATITIEQLGDHYQLCQHSAAPLLEGQRTLFTKFFSSLDSSTQTTQYFQSGYFAISKSCLSL